jgi:hypothetical protein
MYLHAYITTGEDMIEVDKEYKRPSKGLCLQIAEQNFLDGDEQRMWQWLLEWATWKDDLECTVTPEYVAAESFAQRLINKIMGWS